MEITYLGHSCFRLKGKSATVVTDPFTPDLLGLKFPKHVAADIITVSHDHKDHNAVGQIEGSAYIVSGPGEYEIKGVGIIGISAFHDDERGAKRGKNTLYRIEIDGISVVHLGDLGHTLDSGYIDNLDGVDILMIPVGGLHSLDPAKAVSVIHEIEPSIVLPMHYGRPDLLVKTFGDLLPLSSFLKEFGNEEGTPQPKLSVTKDKLPEQTQVVILQ